MNQIHDNAPAVASDGELLARYAYHGDQQAFRELAGRHVDWVYSTARRLTGDSTLAEDVTQGVLMALSSKAHGLARRSSIAGWLFKVTRYSAITLMRAEARRKERERMHALAQPIAVADRPSDDLVDRLDHAVAHLPVGDREALLLRFYQRLSHEQVATSLGISAEAARKRVNRALDRLGRALGISSSSSALGAALIHMPTVAAPAHLLHGAAAGTVSTKAILIAKGVSHMVLVSKLKVALAVSVLTVTTGYLVVTYGQSTQPVAAPAGRATANGSAAKNLQENGNSRATSGRRSASASPGGTAASVPQASGNAQAFAPRTESGGRVIGTGMSFTTEGETTIRRLWDGTHDITLTSAGPRTSVTIRDAAGNVLFDGPYVTDADKAKLPADPAEKVARLAALAGVPTPAGGFGQAGGTGGMASGRSFNPGPGNMTGGGGGFGALGPDYHSGKPGGGFGAIDGDPLP